MAEGKFIEKNLDELKPEELTTYAGELQKLARTLKDENAERRIKTETLSKELQTIRDEIEAQKQTKDKENEKELLEKEEFKTLAEKRQAELDKLTAELPKYKAIEAKYTEIMASIEEKRQEELKRLPIDKQTIYKNSPIEVIQDVSNLLKSPIHDPMTPNLHGGGGADIRDMHSVALAEMLGGTDAEKKAALAEIARRQRGI